MRNFRGFARASCAIAILAVTASAQTIASPENAKPSASISRAQPTDATPSSASSSGEDNIKNFFERTVKLSGSIRARWESTQGKDFRLTPSDSYLLERARLGVAFQPTPWLRFFGEAQDAHAMFYKTNPGTSVSNPFDLRQVYIEGGKLEGNGFKLRAGRQDLLLGSGRLVGTGDWGLTKTFDIVRGSFTFARFKLDLLGGSQILIDPTRMDRDRPGERFYAAYSTFSKLIPGASVEPYFMAKTAMNMKSKDGKLGDADILYAGGRVIGAWRGIDYNFEGVREAGGYSSDTVRAWGYVTGGGWTISKRGWRPRISSDYLYATGDSGVKDGTHQSFDFLYGLQQPLNSMTGQFSWRNLKNWRAGVDFSPLAKLKLKVDYRDYWLATTMDGLYNASGTRTVFNTKATSGHVGEGIEAQAIFSINRKTLVGFGFGNLAVGSYLKQSGKTSGYLYPTLALTRQL